MMTQLRHRVVYPDPAPAPVEAPAQPAPAPAQGQGNAGPNAPPGVLMRVPSKRTWIGLRLAQALLAAAAPPAVSTRVPSKRAWIGLRLAQALLAAAALAAMASARDFVPVRAFRITVSVAALQCLWSLALAILNLYEFLVGRSLRNPRVDAIRSVEDWITGPLTFAASSTSGAITILISNDTATVMAFLSLFCLVILNRVVERLQGP